MLGRVRGFAAALAALAYLTVGAASVSASGVPRRRAGARRILGRVTVLTFFFALCVPAAGFASPRARLTIQAPASVNVDGLATVQGQASHAGTASVVVERRTHSGWVTVAKGWPSARGRFALTWIVGKHTGAVSLRAVASRRGRVLATSRTRKLVVHSRHGGATVAVSPNTRVIDPSTVSSVPGPGSSGKLVYAGGDTLQVGQIVAIGQGPATPDGFLGKVTGVVANGQQTTVTTQPATLLQAVTSASFTETIASSAAVLARARRALAHAADTSVTCQGSAEASVTPEITFGTSLDLSGRWSLLHGLESASLTAGAHATASLTATIEGKGSCSLSPTTVFEFAGPEATFFVGPVPVVLTSEISVDLDAGASASAQATTAIGGGFSAEAGVGWTKSGGFSPIEQFSPNFTYTPPSVTADTSIEADLTPNIDVLLYGVAGPQLSLKTGLAFDASTTQTPWWTLTAPVDLSASLDIPALKLSSPSLDLYKHTFTIASASTPPPKATFDGSSGTGAPPSTMGPYTMQSFGTDATPEGDDVSDVLGPTGEITFDNPLQHDLAGGDWQTWSNGYSGDVYEDDTADDDSNDYEITITLPPNTGAFYLYAEPGDFEDFDMSATTDDGTTSGDTTVYGQAGAQFFGFYTPCGQSISSVEVTDTGGDIAMAVGEFGIAPSC
jgi:hypothetical protein